MPHPVFLKPLWSLLNCYRELTHEKELLSEILVLENCASMQDFNGNHRNEFRDRFVSHIVINWIGSIVASHVYLQNAYTAEA
jgi:hypothetical protein